MIMILQNQKNVFTIHSTNSLYKYLQIWARLSSLLSLFRVFQRSFSLEVEG